MTLTANTDEMISLYDSIDRLRRERDDAYRLFAAVIIANGGRLEIPNCALTHAVLNHKELSISRNRGIDSEVFIVNNNHGEYHDASR